MLGEIQNVYDLLKKHFPNLAVHTDSLIDSEKEKFIKSVEPLVRKVVEQRTKNVSDIKGSFLDRVTSQSNVNDNISREVLSARKMGRSAFQNDVKKVNGDYRFIDKSLPPASLGSDELVTAWDDGYGEAEVLYRTESEKKEWKKMIFWTGVKVGIGIGIGIYVSRLFKKG